MSCTSSASYTARAFLGTSTSAFRPGPYLPFLYNTRTIQRRRFHRTSCTTDESASSPNLGPLVRYTTELEPTHEARGRPTSRHDRKAGRHGFQHPQSDRRRDWIHKSLANNETRDTHTDLQNDLGLEDLHPERTSKSYSREIEANDENDLPFDISASTKPQLRPDSSSTMTDLERDAFARLFGSLATSLPSSTMEESEEDDEGLPPSFMYELDELEKKDRPEYDIESDLDQELQNEAPNLEMYPETLRGMAAKAQLQLARERLLRDRGKQETETSMNEVTIASGKEMKRIAKKMAFVRSDAELWDILEQEIFTKVLALNLNQSSKSPAKSKSRKPLATNVTGSSRSSTSSGQGTELAVFARVYPSILYRAIRLLATRAAFTPLVFSLLPACKALGISSYVLGVTTSFYNELLAYTWRFPNNLRTMLDLLHEMDEAGLTMDTETWKVLEEVTLYRYRAIRGDFGEGVRVAEGMSERMREGKEIFLWKREIRRRTEQAALSRVQAIDINRKLAKEEEEEELLLIPGLQMNTRAPVSAALA